MYGGRSSRNAMREREASTHHLGSSRRHNFTNSERSGREPYADQYPRDHGYRQERESRVEELGGKVRGDHQAGLSSDVTIREGRDAGGLSKGRRSRDDERGKRSRSIPGDHHFDRSRGYSYGFDRERNLPGLGGQSVLRGRSSEPLENSSYLKVAGLICDSNKREINDCFCRSGVFHLKVDRVHPRILSRLCEGTDIFLYDHHSRELHGLFEVATSAMLPDGYEGSYNQFAEQVCVRVSQECLPLPEREFKEAIGEKHDSSTNFSRVLTKDQVSNLLELFRPLSRVPRGGIDTHRNPQVQRITGSSQSEGRNRDMMNTDNYLNRSSTFTDEYQSEARQEDFRRGARNSDTHNSSRTRQRKDWIEEEDEHSSEDDTTAATPPPTDSYSRLPATYQQVNKTEASYLPSRNFSAGRTGRATVGNGGGAEGKEFEREWSGEWDATSYGRKRARGTSYVDMPSKRSAREITPPRESRRAPAQIVTGQVYGSFTEEVESSYEKKDRGRGGRYIDLLVRNESERDRREIASLGHFRRPLSPTVTRRSHERGDEEVEVYSDVEEEEEEEAIAVQSHLDHHFKSSYKHPDVTTVFDHPQQDLLLNNQVRSFENGIVRERSGKKVHSWSGRREYASLPTNARVFYSQQEASGFIPKAVSKDGYAVDYNEHACMVPQHAVENGQLRAAHTLISHVDPNFRSSKNFQPQGSLTVTVRNDIRRHNVSNLLKRHTSVQDRIGPPAVPARPMKGFIGAREVQDPSFQVTLSGNLKRTVKVHETETSKDLDVVDRSYAWEPSRSVRGVSAESTEDPLEDQVHPSGKRKSAFLRLSKPHDTRNQSLDGRLSRPVFSRLGTRILPRSSAKAYAVPENRAFSKKLRKGTVYNKDMDELELAGQEERANRIFGEEDLPGVDGVNVDFKDGAFVVDFMGPSFGRRSLRGKKDAECAGSGEEIGCLSERENGHGQIGNRRKLVRPSINRGIQSSNEKAEQQNCNADNEPDNIDRLPANPTPSGMEIESSTQAPLELPAV